MRLWMYESWCQDQFEKHDFAKEYALFTGSFANPEMAKEIIKNEKPTHISSDEDFEESTRMMLEDRDKQLKNNNKNERASKKRRRRRQLLNRD